MRRILGLLMLLIGIVGLGISGAGTVLGWRLVDDIGRSLDDNLALTVDSLNTVHDTLLLTRTTVRQLNDGLETVEGTAVTVSQAISETQPLLQNISMVATGQVPDGIEAFQASIPNLAEVAGAIDSTLRALNSFSFNLLGQSVGLGVEYDPEQPFDESILAIGDSLEGVPDELRSLEESLAMTGDNLAAISGDVTLIGDDLSAINASVAEVEPLLSGYIRIITEINNSIRQTRANLSSQLEMARVVVTIVMVWLGLTQIAPLYLGWELLTGRRG